MQFRQVMGLVMEKLKELGRGSQSGPMARSMDGVVCESSKKQGLSVCVCVCPVLPKSLYFSSDS